MLLPTDRQVHMLMTGNAVWGQVSANFADNFYNNVASNGVAGRYPYMWVNWPCNDNYKTGLIMGGHNTILHTGIDGLQIRRYYPQPDAAFRTFQSSESSYLQQIIVGNHGMQKKKVIRHGKIPLKYIDHVTALQFRFF